MEGVLTEVEATIYCKGKLVATVVSDGMEGIRFLTDVIASSMNLRPEQYWFEICQGSDLK